MKRRTRAAFAFAMLVALAIAVVAAAQQSGPEAQPTSPEAKTAKTFSKLVVSPANISFPKGSWQSHYFVIENKGTAPLTINSISMNPTQAFLMTEEPAAGSALQPRSQSTVGVTFQPPVAGRFAATISIVTDATKGSRTASVKLKGMGPGIIPPSSTATPTAAPTSMPSSTPTAAPSSTPSGQPTSSAMISSLSPGSAVVGGGKFTLDVHGVGFDPSAKVFWNGTAMPTTFVSDTELTAAVPASGISSVGTKFVAIASPGFGLGQSYTFLVGTTGGAGYSQLVINQQANDLVYDPLRQVIYLSVPDNAATGGNTISVLDLASGAITTSQFAGSSPDVLAMSDDGQFLYAGLDGQASVQRFTLPALARDISIPLGRNSTLGPYFALDLQVAPGNPHTTAVSLGNMGYSPEADGGVVIFDDATPRSTTVPGVLQEYDSLQWGADAGTLYASNMEVSSFDFYTLLVNQNGVTLGHDYEGAFSDYFARIHFDPGTGLIYSDTGNIIDPSNGNPAGEFPTFGPMVPDSTINAAFFVDNNASPAIVESYNLTEFSLMNSVPLPNLSYLNAASRIIRWGNNGIAFCTFGGPVYVIGGTFVH